MTDVEQIAARLDVLEKRVAVAEQEREAYRKLYVETMERCRRLELGLLASKSEHLPEPGRQLSLDVLSMVLDERKRAELEAALADANAEQHVPAHTRRKPTGRKPLPEHLPRVEIQVLPPEVQKEVPRCIRAHRRGRVRDRRASPRLARGRTRRPAVAPGRHVLFEFTRHHSSDAVDDVLAGFQGFLVADAHVVYDHLYVSGDLVGVNCWLEACERRAGLEVQGCLHKLRHTFCSHLAMRGAPAKAIQELAGHENLMTRLRYMHLSPAARKSAIALLNERVDEGDGGGDFGEIVETGPKSTWGSA